MLSVPSRIRNALSNFPLSAVITAAIVAAFAPSESWSQSDWPNRPLRLIVPQAPGGGGDTIGRIWAECASQQLGQTVVVENRSGANGVLAVKEFSRSPADGHTLFLAGMSQLTITPYIFKSAPYIVDKEFEGVSLLVSSAYIFTASPQSNIKSFADLQQSIKNQPEGLNWGSPGNGSPAHLMSAILGNKLNTQFFHIPFQGEGAALTSIIGGQIDVAPFLVGTALQQIQAGKLPALLVFGDRRIDTLPNVPTAAEVLGSEELSHGSWTSLVTKPGTPRPIIEKLHAATQTCLADPEVKQRLSRFMSIPIAAPIEEVQAYIERDTAVWKPLIEQLGIRND